MNPLDSRQPSDPLAPQRLRPSAGAGAEAVMQRAADLLSSRNAVLNLSADEALRVVTHMQLVNFPRGTTLLRQGDDSKLDHLLLLLEGEVSVDTSAGALSGPLAISVLGPGSIIGEMALLDDAPRSANCVTLSPVQAAMLSRKALEGLIDQHPRVAAKLLLGLGARTAERLRALGEHLQIYAKLVEELQAENQRLRGTR